MIASVVFNRKWESKEYHYLVDFPVHPMDDVLVPVGEHGHVEVATVVAVWAEEIDHKHRSARYLKHVIGRADVGELLKKRGEELEEVYRKYEKLFSKIK